MTDLIQDDWAELDADNTNSSPDGVQGGYAPSTIAPVIRTIRGAIKRFYVQHNPVYTTTGGTNAYVLTYEKAPDDGYQKGIIYSFFAHANNTGSATLNINSLGAKQIVAPDGSALTAGQIAANAIVEVCYNGTNFTLISPVSHSPKFSGTITSGSIGNGFGNINIGSSIFTGNGSGLTALTAANLTGTIADARLPATQAGKTFTSQTRIQAGSSGASANYLIATPTDADVGKPGFFLSKPNGAPTQWNLGLWDGVNSNGNVNVLASSFTRNSYTVWDSGNDGAGSTLDADLLDGQQGSYYLDAANLTGTLPSARLSGSYTGIVGTGALNAGSITSGFGNINIGTAIFTGNGSGLTNLNAGNLASGFISNARFGPTTFYSFGSLALQTSLTVGDYIDVNGAVGHSGFTPAQTASGWKVQADTRLDVISQDQWAITLKRIGSNGQIMQFRRSGTTGVGSISVTTSATTFDTSSDERLKDDLRPIDTSILDSIDPFDFRWKIDGSRGQGFMAQRVHGIIPGFSTHNTDGGDDVWVADYSKITPLLTAVAKEQRAKIRELEGEIKLLKGDVEALKAA